MTPMKRRTPYLLILVNFLLTFLLFIEIYISLHWRMVHDSPILYYMGYLVAHFGAIPYRDFFDMNMPGAHWINALAGSIFGFTDRGFQIANVMILISLLILIYVWLRSFSKISAWAGSIIFGLFFLHYGPAMSMQREFLTLPLLLVALIAYPSSENSSRWRYFVSGLFLSLSVLIKPQSGLIILVFLFFAVFQFQEPRRKFKFHVNWTWKTVVFFFLGFAIPLLSVLVYFFINHGLDSFLEVALKYWPLYNRINARLEVNPTANPFMELITGLRSLGNNSLWILPAIISFILLKKHDQSHQNSNKIIMLVGGVGLSLMEVIFANKYWDYHWLPMLFFLIALSCAGLSVLRQTSKWDWILPVSLYAIVIVLAKPEGITLTNIQSFQQPPPQIGRVDRIVDYLQKNLEPGDTVQPLDWSNGAVQAMLIARAQPASRYMYDFYFYHDVSNPEIRYIRNDLLEKMKENKPKVVIQFFDDRPWVDGHDTTRSFPDLDRYLGSEYYVDYEKDGLRLWMRNN